MPTPANRCAILLGPLDEQTTRINLNLTDADRIGDIEYKITINREDLFAPSVVYPEVMENFKLAATDYHRYDAEGEYFYTTSPCGGMVNQRIYPKVFAELLEPGYRYSVTIVTNKPLDLGGGSLITPTILESKTIPLTVPGVRYEIQYSTLEDPDFNEV